MRQLFSIQSLLLFVTLSAIGTKTFSQTKYFLGLKVKLSIQMPNRLDYILEIKGLKKKDPYSFRLNSGLSILSLNRGDVLVAPGKDQENYTFMKNTDQISRFKIRGNLTNPEAIGPSSIILNSQSEWLPNFGQLFTYEIEIKSEKSLVVYNPSQNSDESDLCGDGCHHYIENQPQEDLHIIVGNYFKYQRTLDNRRKIGILMLSKDDLLAQQYLDLLPEFLERYESKFGPYPYKSFHVVENIKETGFGMPGFTLLGSSVIRLPFILRSSLPHEVLHNWWGNGVYIDTARGNWSEGLTTYGADHLEHELLGTDSEYRRDAMVGYADFVNSEQEFPLNQFKERHSEASQAIGYGKGMMFFHMLRKHLGDIIFFEGLRNIFASFKFQRIGYEEIQNEYEKIAPPGLGSFMQPWINQKGAVEIKAQQNCTISRSVELHIVSNPQEFQFTLPYEIAETSDKEPILKSAIFILNGRGKIEFSRNFKGFIKLDPNFDVFRKLSDGEKPLSISRFLSSRKMYILAEDALAHEAQVWVDGLKRVFAGEVSFINKLDDAPPGSQIIIYGYRDLSKADLVFKHLSADKISVKGNSFLVKNQEIPIVNRGWIIMSYDPEKMQTLTWAVRPDAVEAGSWGKQLSHYSKFGILFFNNNRNELKAAWPEGISNLTMKIEPCPI